MGIRVRNKNGGLLNREGLFKEQERLLRYPFKFFQFRKYPLNQFEPSLIMLILESEKDMIKTVVF
ncbi:hypothetical protein BG30_22240 [Bacillus subtilis subsp. subtilis]|nr:hypothetical protein BG30_22240 [Bacillus subtilis subsp. subtilis]